MLIRRDRGLGTLGEEKKEATGDAKKDLEKKGGSGDWISDAIGIVTSIFGGVGKAKQRRTERTAAQDRLVLQQTNAKALAEDSAQYKGNKISDRLFEALSNEVIHVHGHSQTAATDYYANGTYGT